MAAIPLVAEVVATITSAGKAVAAAREALQRSRIATARTKVMRDDLAAEMSRAEAMIAAAADRPAVLARDQLFAVDMEILTVRMQSLRSALSEYELTPFVQRFLCGDIPDDFLGQNSEWIQSFLEKWQVKIDELISMSPEEVDAQDFARARAIFARPFLLVDNLEWESNAEFPQTSTVGGYNLMQALEDIQVSVVTGLLYKRGTCQKQVLRDLGFSCHHIASRHASSTEAGTRLLLSSVRSQKTCDKILRTGMPASQNFVLFSTACCQMI